MRFTPDQPPIFPGNDMSRLVEWVMRQFNRVSDSQERKNFIRLSKYHVAPAKPEDGLIYYADGTDWDPGSGAGIYYYNGSSWTKLG